MSVSTRFGYGARSWLALACVVALVLTGGLWWMLRDPGNTRVTAYFDKTVGLYPGSSVRVLGIEVGDIIDVRPEGDSVRVSMEVDSTTKIPASAGAVVVAPSLVSDRYVQLAPVYDGGPVMRGGTVINQDRTATPMELDDLYQSLNKVSTTLGPSGANENGALSGVLDTLASNLDGNGKNMNNTVERLSKLSGTLENSKGDFFGTIRNLQSFTQALADSDRQLNAFYERLADVSGFLGGESDNVGAALSALGSSLGEVKQFVADNKGQLTSNVNKLAGITKVLVDQRGALAEILDVAPTGMTNFINTYDAASGSITVRWSSNDLTHPLVTTLCRLLKAGNPENVPQTVGSLCEALAPVVEGVAPVPSVSQLLASIQRGEVPPLPLPIIAVPGQAGGQ